MVTIKIWIFILLLSAAAICCSLLPCRYRLLAYAPCTTELL
eukprot:COSAG06_NODE_9241_length_1949_cov_2.604865_2_plen_41_part_00